MHEHKSGLESSEMGLLRQATTRVMAERNRIICIRNLFQSVVDIVERRLRQRFSDEDNDESRKEAESEH